MNPLRNHKSYIASMGHRLSGLALAAFLPLHFSLLGTALSGSRGLDRALAFTDMPMVKVAEWGLVVLLSIHLLFGIRVLVLEFSDWPATDGNRLVWIVPSIVLALIIGGVFLMRLGI